jgi:hypothetical protein
MLGGGAMSLVLAGALIAAALLIFPLGYTAWVVWMAATKSPLERPVTLVHRVLSVTITLVLVGYLSWLAVSMQWPFWVHCIIQMFNVAILTIWLIATRPHAIFESMGFVMQRAFVRMVTQYVRAHPNRNCTVTCHTTSLDVVWEGVDGANHSRTIKFPDEATATRAYVMLFAQMSNLTGLRRMSITTGHNGRVATLNSSENDRLHAVPAADSQ